MKDFRGVELQVGDKIVYCRRYSSSMCMKETTISEIIPYETERWVWNPSTRQGNYQKVTAHKLRCPNPNRVPDDQWKHEWKQRSPLTVTLRCPEYIVKVG